MLEEVDDLPVVLEVALYVEEDALFETVLLSVTAVFARLLTVLAMLLAGEDDAGLVGTVLLAVLEVDLDGVVVLLVVVVEALFLELEVEVEPLVTEVLTDVAVLTKLLIVDATLFEGDVVLFAVFDVDLDVVVLLFDGVEVLFVAVVEALF